LHWFLHLFAFVVAFGCICCGICCICCGNCCNLSYNVHHRCLQMYWHKP
jgi:hypothetical protein